MAATKSRTKTAPNGKHADALPAAKANKPAAPAVPDQQMLAVASRFDDRNVSGVGDVEPLPFAAGDRLAPEGVAGDGDDLLAEDADEFEREDPNSKVGDVATAHDRAVVPLRGKPAAGMFVEGPSSICQANDVIPAVPPLNSKVPATPPPPDQVLLGYCALTT